MNHRQWSAYRQFPRQGVNGGGESRACCSAQCSLANMSAKIRSLNTSASPKPHSRGPTLAGRGGSAFNSWPTIHPSLIEIIWSHHIVGVPPSSGSSRTMFYDFMSSNYHKFRRYGDCCLRSALITFHPFDPPGLRRAPSSTPGPRGRGTPSCRRTRPMPSNPRPHARGGRRDLMGGRDVRSRLHYWRHGADRRPSDRWLLFAGKAGTSR